MSGGILCISGGSLLLLVNNYGDSLVPSTPLGLVLLILAGLLALTGLSRPLACPGAAVGLLLSPPAGSGQDQLWTCLCLTISALWSGSGVLYLLRGLGVLEPSQLSSALLPALAAATVALFSIGSVALATKKLLPSLIAVAVGLACAHQVAGLTAADFGQTASAANYLVVSLVGGYCGLGRLMSAITQGAAQLPGPGVRVQTGQNAAAAAAVGAAMNLLSASVVACPLLGLVPQLSVAHGPWLCTAGLFQSSMCVLSYRAMDPLAATSLGFTSVLRFAEGYSALSGSCPPAAPLAVFSLLFLVLAVCGCHRSLLDAACQLLFSSYCIAAASQRQGFFHSSAQSVQAAIFVVSVAMLAVRLAEAASAKPLGSGQSIFKRLASHVRGLQRHAPDLGYSKYADAELLGHGCSVAAASALALASHHGPGLPWLAMAATLQLLAGAVAFSRGKTFESTVFIFHGVMWLTWGWTRCAAQDAQVRGFNVAAAFICFMLFDVLVAAAATLLSAAWFASAMASQLVVASFVLDALDAQPRGFDTAASVIFGLVSFYCFVAQLFNSTFTSPRVPLGEPLVKLAGVRAAKTCPHLPANRATSVQQVADIMKRGGVCGIPTDTVYVLVAACNRPEAVARAFSVKKQAQARPMSLWLSSIKQLDPVRHLLSPLLLDFMEAVWPSSISVVVPRGPWMETLGLGEAAQHVGTQQSVAIRSPDCSVATRLLSQVGPIAVTSANPTGEADTTHHNQVHAKLGHKVDGVLCDGPSPQNIASTVVDCTRIESGHIAFFRVGRIPKSKVLHIFAQVQKKHRCGRTNPAFENHPAEERR
ncbi:uncharacterized protein si:ch211-153b23.4 [Synchiropus splendidus]|uniref:uncharacterized protein si:ch211-153b23.4 n=1 Tax=Synchiropus splendidus TaxID=270530 RepID=UPI00237D3553|nr:uncharacterized protein si:ch211-153b23.4 [Synchiropus splendidus]